VASTLSNLQARAARALLGWSQQQLADAAGLSVITVKRFEAGGRGSAGSSRDTTGRRIAAALEDAGIDFMPQKGGYSHGVRLRGRTE
jgi:transcriptional regulator with XRE-family HTH domain